MHEPTQCMWSVQAYVERNTFLSQLRISSYGPVCFVFAVSYSYALSRIFCVPMEPCMAPPLSTFYSLYLLLLLCTLMSSLNLASFQKCSDSAFTRMFQIVRVQYK